MPASLTGYPTHPIAYPFPPESQPDSPAPSTPLADSPLMPAEHQQAVPGLPRHQTRSGPVLPGLLRNPADSVEFEHGASRRRKRESVQAPEKPRRHTLGVLGNPPSHSGDADKNLQAQLISTMGSVTDSSVTVPARSLISQPYALFKQVVNQPEVLAWLRGKGFSLDSVVIGSNSVSGFVTHNGVVSRQTYSLQDTSGWWQVSARVMRALEALDPTHHGVPYVTADSPHVSRNVASLFYGVQPAVTQEQASTLVKQMEANWPPLSATETRNHLLRLEWSTRGINALDDQENLADALERAASGIADSAPISLANIGFSPVLSEPVPGAPCTDERCTLQEVARSMNLDELDTAGDVRAAANWLRTRFAPPPQDSNYAQLLPKQWAVGTLSANDKRALAALATDQKYGANTVGAQLGRRLVTQVIPQDTAANADRIWHQLLNTPLAQAWGRELAQHLNWTQRTDDDAAGARQRRALVTSAILLSVDPQAPASPGHSAGYHFYAPANMGREMRAVRKDFERHLVEEKGVSVRAAPLLAHLFLAHAAPEFLVKPNPPHADNTLEQLGLSVDAIRIGSPAWMTLNLGTALAEVWGGAGASRGMNLNELGALTMSQAFPPAQQALVEGLGAKVVLDVGVMAGIVPQRSDDQYTAEDYHKARDGIERRAQMLENAIETLGASPPTRTGLAFKALKPTFPELTDDELQTLTLRKPATKFDLIGSGVNAKKPTLVEAYATGDLHKGPFGFTHPLITQAEFDRRIASLEKIADQVPGAVDGYLGDTKAAMPALMKMTLANLPLDIRQALEWGTVDIYRLRQETGETQPQDAATGNKVARNRGWHGSLLRVRYQDKTHYCEFFPASGKIIDRTADLAGKNLKLNEGVIEEVREYLVRKPSRVHRYLRGTQQPFDFNAYLTGEAPRPGASSKVIISRVGASLGGSSATGQGGSRNEWVPDTFESVKTQAIVDTLLQGNYIGNYSGHRQALLDYANAVLPSEDNAMGYVDRLMSKENGRALVSMISFVGALVDIYEGSVSQGVKGLLIDLVSLIGTGGLQTVYKTGKAIRLASRLNRQAFVANSLKESNALLRALFNPTEGFLGLWDQPGKLSKFLTRTQRGLPVKVGMGVYVPADLFEKARFSQGTFPSVSEMLEKANAAPFASVPSVVN